MQPQGTGRPRGFPEASGGLHLPGGADSGSVGVYSALRRGPHAYSQRVEEAQRWVPRDAEPNSDDEEPWWFSGLLKSAGFFVFGALLGLVLIGIDYAAARDVPRERAEVVAVELSGQQTSCGRDLFDSTDEEVATLRVESPRPGLPSTVEVRSCPDNYVRGESVLLARQGDGGTDVAVDPPSGGDLLPFAVMVGAITAAAALMFWFVPDAVRHWWQRRNGAPSEAG
ncbi:hypothetical protein GCM10025872_30360 [Barrientosiimonas endolithica]|uniref:DUF3592 domain-containing protein n=1 Tax=Barrientosiimonas endolithica TaxID=1535208 RepID=A0ABM8HEH8_9MICO|nr:hypothetical protein GCM10025872_30360 [Barrientosiimonas endolithica]